MEWTGGWRPGRREVLAMAALVPAWASPVVARAEPRAGLVLTVNGEAMAELGRERRALAADGPVFIGDRVATGDATRAALRLGQATELRLGERARITIDRFLTEAGGTITLGAGALLVDKTPGSDPRSLRIRSSYGVRGARHALFRRSQQRRLRGLRRARKGLGARRRTNGDAGDGAGHRYRPPGRGPDARAGLGTGPNPRRARSGRVIHGRSARRDHRRDGALRRARA